MGIKQQSGAALIISLLILLVLTLLGLSSMRTSSMEELMARNTRDFKVAFEAADSSLNDSSFWIDGLSLHPPECSTTTNCNTNVAKVYRSDVLANINTLSTSWWESTATQEFLTAGTKDITEANTDPRFVMESKFVSDSLRQGHAVPTGKQVYTVTGRGTGIKSSTQVLVQQTVIKRFN